MAWLSLPSLRTREEKIRELAHRVAASVVADVEERVSHRLAELPLAQARGYVRARSAGLLRRELDKALAEHPRLERCRTEAQGMANDALVRQVIWNELRSRSHRQESVAARRAA